MERHAICIPFPAQGHIKPMLKLAQILHSKFDFHITFINTHHFQNTLFQTHPTSITNPSDTTTTFKFESIQPLDGVQDDDSKDILSVIHSILSCRLEPPLRGLLSELCSKNDPSSPTEPRPSPGLMRPPRPPVTCMVTDVAMTSFTLAVAEDMGIPAVVLETVSACGFMAYLQLRKLLDKGIIPLPDTNCLTNGYLKREINWITSLKGIQLKDMPTFLRTTDQYDMMLNAVMSNAYRALKSKAILINTFDSLEQDVLEELKTISPNMYSIGPLHLLANHIATNDNNLPIVKPSPKIEDECIIKWLDSQEPRSVLYVSFGTLAVITQEQLVEFAWGLANSHQKFVWVVRSDLVKGEPNSIVIPVEFEKEIEGRGLLVSWCDQEQVLAHPSVGGFLTHCGWNSIIESVSNGVPMICWPFVADQVTNSWYVCSYLGIGTKLNEEVARDEVERAVKELVEGMKGKEMKKKAMEFRKLAREATMSPNGSSYVNLESIVNNMLIP